MTAPTGDPILIRCEGSGCPPCTDEGGHGMCAMCGRWHVLVGVAMPEHERDDIIARLNRGDFG